MRLLLLSSEFPPGPGGIGTHAQQLARELVRLGWEITVVTPQDYSTDEEIESFNKEQPFLVRRLHRKGSRWSTIVHRWRTIGKTIRDFSPTLGLATGSRAASVAAAMTLRSAIPWVAVGHGTEFGLRGQRHEMRMKWSYGRASCVICVSRYTWDFMWARGIRPALSCVIPNGADDSRFRVVNEVETLRFRADLPDKAKHILLTVGNVTERKGQEIVIRAMPRILQSCPGTHYYMIGLPTLKDTLQRLAQELGVADHVHFVGRVSGDDLVRWLNGCDLFVMTSRNTADGDFEGYGIAVVEAALCGKPSIVSDGCGLAEAIVDGKTGIKVPQNDPVATADAIVSMIRNDQAASCKSMGPAAHERAWREQTWRLRAHEYDAVLQRVLGRPDGEFTPTFIHFDKHSK